MVSLGVLPGFTDSGAHNINDLGEVVGYCAAAGAPNRGFHWTSAAGMQPLAPLPGGLSSDAVGINGLAQIVGAADSGDPDKPHAVLWAKAGIVQDLGVLPGGTWSSAFAINASATVVGNGNCTSSGAHAFVWTARSGIQDLNALIPANSGWVLQSALAINDAGEIVGVGTVNGNQHGFLLKPQGTD
jgi:probable HAF family extracellular repeat protein